jgi:hypothetical protein
MDRRGVEAPAEGQAERLGGRRMAWAIVAPLRATEVTNGEGMRGTEWLKLMRFL